MTEEIIIDGCNVKDCRRRIGKNNYCRYYKRPCADNNYNCIWKKCLRLEQENRELGRKAFLAEQNARTTAATFCEKDDKINELEQENKELKEENKTLNYQWHKQSEIGDEWYKIAEKYKTALEEISGLASPHCTQCSQIINIIKEVLK